MSGFRVFCIEKFSNTRRDLLIFGELLQKLKKLISLDYFEKRYCSNCGALIVRKQIDYTIDVGGIVDRSYGTSVTLPAHQVYWECPNCAPESTPPPPGSPHEYY